MSDCIQLKELSKTDRHYLSAAAGKSDNPLTKYNVDCRFNSARPRFLNE